MIEEISIEVNVNGGNVRLHTEPRRMLADVLRDELGLRSVHLGCEQGACGGCTVLVDGEPVASCMMFAAQAEGHFVQTLEGLAGTDRLELLQTAFHKHYALQCGYCIPGVLTNLYALLEEGGPVTEADVRARLSGNLCRCTGYQNMVAAAVAASQGLSEPDAGLEELSGVDLTLASRLKAHGYTTREAVAAASIDELARVPGIGSERAVDLIREAGRTATSGEGAP